jgi:hypothetical protein
MKHRSTSVVPLLAVVLFISACGGSQAGDETRLGVALSDFLNANSLSAGSLDATALSAAALGAAALDPDMIGASAMAALQDPGSGGDLARQLFKYSVSCALDDTQSFGLSWTDGTGTVHDETYPGLVGLATYWASGPLDPGDQEWISACLISRVNYYGIEVMLSSRGSSPELASPSEDELDTYVDEEGAFWGNVFAASPYAFSCNYAPDVDNSRSLYRDCAAGHVDGSGDVVPCGIIQLMSSCDAICAALDPTLGYVPTCPDADGSPTASVVTVFLP